MFFEPFESTHLLFNSINHEWVTVPVMWTYSPILWFTAFESNTLVPRVGVVSRRRDTVWNILLFMSVHVRVSAPGNIKCKATPVSQTNYRHRQPPPHTATDAAQLSLFFFSWQWILIVKMPNKIQIELFLWILCGDHTVWWVCYDLVSFFFKPVKKWESFAVQTCLYLH